MPQRLIVTRGDITEQQVDVIVNAANQSLCGGGGVDGAIHRAAGPELLAECRTLGGCPTGEARITAGYQLPARHIVHTPGPVWRGGDAGEDELLASSYRNSLRLADGAGAETVAFPSISTGAYRFPIRRAATIAVGTLLEALESCASVREVRIVCFSEADRRQYQGALERLVSA